MSEHISTAVGLCINIKSTQQAIESMRALDADRHVDVMITIDDRRVEMTMEEFIRRVFGGEV